MERPDTFAVYLALTLVLHKRKVHACQRDKSVKPSKATWKRFQKNLTSLNENESWWK